MLTAESIFENLFLVVVVKLGEVNKFFLLETNLDGLEVLSGVSDLTQFERIAYHTLFRDIPCNFDI